MRERDRDNGVKQNECIKCWTEIKYSVNVSYQILKFCFPAAKTRDPGDLTCYVSVQLYDFKDLSQLYVASANAERTPKDTCSPKLCPHLLTL